jgi:hypothetical protein
MSLSPSPLQLPVQSWVTGESPSCDDFESLALDMHDQLVCQSPSLASTAATTPSLVVARYAECSRPSDADIVAAFGCCSPRLIGNGSLCCVYSAVDRRSGAGEPCAIKVLQVKDRRRDDLRVEAQRLDMLRHPNIVRRLPSECSVDEMSGFALVTELADIDLCDALIGMRDANLRLSVDDVRRVFRQIVCAVAFTHANGVVHRDIKLDNVLVFDASVSDVRVRDADGSSVIARVPTRAARCVGTLRLDATCDP